MHAIESGKIVVRSVFKCEDNMDTPPKKSTEDEFERTSKGQHLLPDFKLVVLLPHYVQEAELPVSSAGLLPL